MPDKPEEQPYDPDDHTNREWCEEHGEDYNTLNGIKYRDPGINNYDGEES